MHQKKYLYSYNPKDNSILEGKFPIANLTAINQAMELANKAFYEFKQIDFNQKADFLDAIADEILNLGDELLDRANLETALPKARLIGERGRTINQLKMFANLVRENNWQATSIDLAQPDRSPAPKPDLRKMLIPLGPVVVFGASNFPLAYSVAGGDTASALAAGCPVVVKAHSAHAGTSQLVAKAILKAAEKTKMPDGVFSILYDDGFEVGKNLVEHPLTKAVGFTGSLKGGKALFDLANKRLVPIPVFAEMGSINPIFVFSEKMKNDAENLGKAFAKSITLGVGQFCTNPGLILVQEKEGFETFKQTLIQEIEQVESQTMLHQGIAKNYQNNSKKALQQRGVELLNKTKKAHLNVAEAIIASVSVNNFLNNPELKEEVFGPFSLIVKCQNEQDFEKIIHYLDGQLTATIVAEESELSNQNYFLQLLQEKVGRLIFNGVPTGVEVCESMQHGGPFPATTDARFTAVGISAIQRFTRPIAFQDFPKSALPAILQIL